VNNFLFRVSNHKIAGNGHISRSIQVAEALAKLGHKVTFLLDNIYFESNSNIVQSLNRFDQIILNKFSLKNARTRVTVDWGKFDYLILDSNNPCSEQSLKKFSKNKIIQIVDDPNKLLEDVNHLKIGIKFGNINEDVVYPIRVLPQNIPSIKKNKILIYFGSAINLKLLSFILANLIGALEQSGNTQLSILIYCSKKSKKYKRLKKILGKDIFYNQATLIDDIDTHLNETLFVIGSASTILYETSFLNIPMITLAMNKSQENSDWQLERLGHFINFQNLRELYSPKIKNLFLHYIHHIDAVKKESFKQNKRLLKNSALICAEAISNKDFVFSPYKDYKEINLDISVSQLQINHINKMLDARNSPEVNKYFIYKDKISKIEHYIWWFENKRSNYILSWGNKVSMYIWHELIEIPKPYWIGGWMPIVGTLDVRQIIEAIQWQFKETAKNKKYPWLAVVHETNQSVIFVSQRLGFREVEKDSIEFNDAKKVFKFDSSKSSFKVFLKD
jgi:spore coat polysaccharide biosynthesis predicted glycosyltransferase SpsG